jgi:alcohol dehydrogenase
MTAFDFTLRTRIIFGPGAIERLPELARALDFKRTLLVADPGLAAAGHVQTAASLLEQSGIAVYPFHEFSANPDADMVHAAQRFAQPLRFDSVLALGGGSSMDLAKAVNLVCHNEGFIARYQGYGKVENPLAPMIAIPTTAGTGSEAQTHAIIAHTKTHLKMAIGDARLAFRAAILDPALTLSQPGYITATAGYDAISHAVESYVTTRRNPMSDCFAREAWRLLSHSFECVLKRPNDTGARGGMLLGSHFAGAAIEASMLGATHACANPLTAKYGIAHGAAIALLLPHVVRWNASAAADLYRELYPEGDLADRLDELARAAGLPARLAESGVHPGDLPELAAAAAEQWTGRFNPRPFGFDSALEIYRCAF